MKQLIYTFALIILTINVFSQVTESEKKLRTLETDTVTGWKRGGTIVVNLSQSELSNWAAGGQSAITINSLLSIFANYKSPKSSWDNSLDIGFGLMKQGSADWWKNDDRFDFTSKYGRKAFEKGFYAVLLNVKTQLRPGFQSIGSDVKISNFFAPGYITGALGIDYKPHKNLTLFFAPATTRFTFVNDQKMADKGAFGVDKAKYSDDGLTLLSHGKKSRAELGGYVRASYKLDLMQNITMQTKIDLFSNYMKNPQNIDVNWEMLISMKVNKYISATLTMAAIYDDDVKFGEDTNNDGTKDKFTSKLQFKEVLGVGLSYKF
jgi:hypothetical protein